MNKSEIFFKAHKIAKSSVKITGNYLIAFSFALRSVYKEIKSQISKVVKAEFKFGNSMVTAKIDAANPKEWVGGDNLRMYFDVLCDKWSILKFYEVISGSTRDEKITIKGRTFAFQVVGLSNTKRNNAREAAISLATQIEAL